MSGVDLLQIFDDARKDFPDAFQLTDVTWLFTLTDNKFGFTAEGKTVTEQGDPIDLTGSTVKLVVKRFPRKARVVEIAAGFNDLIPVRLFDITGDITDAPAGKVSFDLDNNNTDTIGMFLGEIEIKDSSGKFTVAGQFRFRFKWRINQ